MTECLHPGSRLLLFVLWDLADDEHVVHVSTAELLRRTGWTNRSSVRRHLARLTEAGVIEVEPTSRPDGGRGPNRIHLLEGRS